MKPNYVILLLSSFFRFALSDPSGCIGSVNGYNYDFTGLIGETDYEIESHVGNNPWKMIINICQATVGEGTPSCQPSGSMGCQNWDLPNPTNYASLGLPGSMKVATIMSSGEFKGYNLTFTGGLRKSGSTEPTSTATQMSLLCTPGAGQGTPNVKSTAGGKFILEWNTDYVCPGVTPPPPPSNICKGTIDGQNYDFTGLIGETDYEVENHIGPNAWKMIINICQATVGEGTPPCQPSGSMGCQNWDLPNPTNSASLGIPDSMKVATIMSSGEFKGYNLTFTGGLRNSGTSKPTPTTTQMALLCTPGTGQGTPNVKSTAGGKFILEWNTDYVCPGVTPPPPPSSVCIGTIDGYNYDFTGLIGETDYEVESHVGNNPWKMIINICQATVGEGTPQCQPSGSMGCQNWDLPNPTNYASLGLPDSMKVATIMSSGQYKGYNLTFTGGLRKSGSTEPTSTATQMSLLCTPGAGQGTPNVKSTSGGKFILEWNTDYVCLNFTTSPSLLLTSGGGGFTSSRGSTGGDVMRHPSAILMILMLLSLYGSQ